MNYRYELVIAFCCVALHLLAQQPAQYSLYMLNPYAVNPAVAGMDQTLVANGVYRAQWVGLDGAPTSQHINAHLPLSMVSSGVGLKMENDVLGAHRTTRVVGSYAFHRAINRNTVLSAGVGFGFLQYALDGAKLRTVDGQYEPRGPISNNDPNLPDGKVQAGIPLAEAGIYLQNTRFQVGLGLTPAFAPRLNSSSSQNGALALRVRRGWFAHAIYNMVLNDRLVLRPSFLLKSDITETQMEISVVGRWDNNIFAGASWRGYSSTSRDALVILGGLPLNEKTTLAYAYDVPLSALQAVQRGSHEISLRYSLNRPIGAGKLPPVIYNPRFF